MPTSAQLLLMFQYLGGIFAVRNTGSLAIVDSRAVTASDAATIHKMLLTDLYHVGTYNNAMIHENEISLLRNLGNITDNEIKKFLGTFTNWDVLILSVYSVSDLIDVPGYTTVKKSSSATTFYHNYVYIASKQFMQKAAANDFTNLQTYIYTNPFLETFSNKNAPVTDKYIVSQVVGLDNLDSTEAHYKWREISI
jgi:hypothetical protein